MNMITWADGFGRWYAAVPTSEIMDGDRKAFTAAGQLARRAILAELEARGNGQPIKISTAYVGLIRDGDAMRYTWAEVSK